jgi:hypothetical protein
MRSCWWLGVMVLHLVVKYELLLMMFIEVRYVDAYI